MSVQTMSRILGYGDRISDHRKNEIIDFLHTHLGEYGDSKTDIGKAIDHIFILSSQPGGFIGLSYDDAGLSGAVVVNRTGMKGYIPENILVYIAVRGDLRGKGIGTILLRQAIDTAQGDICLHVEPHNPAKRLYEKMGFENKYLEMRLVKK